MVASRTLVFPCIELLKWLIDHTNAQKCVINDDNGQIAGVFLPVEYQNYYKLRELDECLNTDFFVKFYQKHDTTEIMVSWWREHKKFTNRNSSWYPMTNLRQPYIYLMALLCRLHGEKYFSTFLEAWMPLAYTIAISGTSFNWGAIISKQLITCILQAQQLKEGETHAFDMASYLLYVICARNAFTGMNLSWHTSKLLVHVYFNILWENRYKISYSLICDQFIAPIHFLLFKKECPRLSDAAKKVISKVGHWYLDESKEGAGAGCIIIDLAGNKTLLSCRLEFECTNNVAEYEALLQGLRKALDMRIQNLIVFGDSEIVVRQVRNSIHCLTLHLKCYQSEVWSLINQFSAFNINSIPRSSNVEADLLANVASKLLPADGLSPNAFSVELLFRPSIPDNITNWRVFEDDQQIINFLHMEETFHGAVIDEQTHNDNLRDFTVIPNPKPPEALSDMVNFIPKSVARLEKFYDFEDKFKKMVNCKTNSSSLTYEKVNLGTNENP
jgi:ribonuclease HI